MIEPSPIDDGAAQAVLGSANAQLSAQLRAVDNLDQKCERAAALAVVMATGFAAAASFVSTQAGDWAVSAAVLASVFVTLAFGAVVFFLRRAYAIGEWHTGARPDELSAVAAGNAPAPVKLWLTEEAAEAFLHNMPLLAAKAREASNLLWAVGAQAGAISIGLTTAAILELVKG